MDRERVVASIVALLFIIAIRKAQRLRFLALYLVFERRQRDLTNALLTTRIKRVRERGEWRGYIRDRKGGLKKYIQIRSCFRYGKTTLEFLKRHLTTFVNWWGHTFQGKTRV